MKKISSEARCTSANGKERRREIREPFGSGIDKYREAEAIRQNPPRPVSGAYRCIFRERKRSSRSFAPRINDFSVRLRGSAVKRGDVQVPLPYVPKSTVS